MSFRQVCLKDKDKFTNLQILLGSKGEKQEFGPYGKSNQRIHLQNGDLISVAETPMIGADTLEYYLVEHMVEIPMDITMGRGDRASWTLKPLPKNWPKQAYAKGIDLTTDIHISR